MSRRPEFDSDLMRCISVLRRQGVVIYPTDTIWGIGCDALSEIAVKRIFRLKKRSDSKSMIVLMPDWEMVARHTAGVPEAIRQEIDRSERPVTLVCPGANGLAAGLAAEDASIGIRIPKDAFLLAMLARLGKPLVSTSANFSDESFTGAFSGINPELLKQVDYVVRWRQAEIIEKAPSRVLKLENDGSLTVIRD